MKRPSVAALARQHGLSWHEANARYAELAAAVGAGPTDGPSASLDLDALAALVAGMMGRRPEAAAAPPGPPPPPDLFVECPGRPTRIGVLADTHFPYHDPRAIELALAALADWGPDLIVHLGDVYDFYMISRFAKDPRRGRSVAEEVRSADAFWADLAAFGCPVYVLKGNHDDRLDQRLNEAGGMAGLTSVDELARAGDRVTWLPSQAHLRVGPVVFLHGDVRGKNGGKHAARSLLDRLNVTFVCGHFHREDRAGTSDYHRRPRRGVVVPCLARLEESWEYNRVPDSVNGFAAVDVDHDEGLADVQTFVVDSGRVRAFGRTYRA